MHEAKVEKWEEMIFDGDGDKIKWGEFLTEFAGQDVARMLVAAETLNVSQLESIISVCQEAISESRKRQLDSFKAQMIAQGIKADELIAFLGGKAAKSGAGTHGGSRRMTPEKAKAYDRVAELTEMGYGPADITQKLADEVLPEISPSTMYAIRSKVNKGEYVKRVKD